MTKREPIWIVVIRFSSEENAKDALDLIESRLGFRGTYLNYGGERLISK